MSQPATGESMPPEIRHTARSLVPTGKPLLVYASRGPVAQGARILAVACARLGADGVTELVRSGADDERAVAVIAGASSS